LRKCRIRVSLQNKVKGYIAHARKIIVLSKTAPFPPLVLK
jgi:hypothetical protein